MASPSVEDYIKAIYTAINENDFISTQDLADRMQVSAPAVSKMMRRLTALRLVEHTPYPRIKLTEAGEKSDLHSNSDFNTQRIKR